MSDLFIKYIYIMLFFLLIVSCNTNVNVKKDNNKINNDNTADRNIYEAYDNYLSSEDTKFIHFFINISNKARANGKYIFEDNDENTAETNDNPDFFYDYDQILKSSDKLMMYKIYKDTIIDSITGSLKEYNKQAGKFFFFKYSENPDDDLIIIMISEINESEFNLKKYNQEGIQFKFKPGEILFDVYRHTGNENKLLFRKKISGESNKILPNERSSLKNVCSRFAKYLIKFLKRYYFE